MRQIILFFAIGFLLLGALNLVARTVGTDPLVDQMDRELSGLAGREAVTLGGSVGVSVDYEAMCIDGVDYYWDGQDLFEAIAIARLARESGILPEHVLIPVSPMALEYDNAVAGSGRTASRRAVHRLLQRHGNFRTISGDWQQTIISLLVPALGFDAWGGRIDGVLAEIGVRDGQKTPPQSHEPRDATMAPLGDQAAVDELLLEQFEAVHEMSYYDPTIAERSERNLLDFIASVRNDGGQVAIVVTPLPEKIRQAMRREMPEEVANFDRALRNFRQAGALIVDRLSMPQISVEQGHFADPIHLNARGAAVFSRAIAPALTIVGVSPAAECPGP